MSYVLGSTRDETKRLELQSRVFENETVLTLKRAGINTGMRCIDLGCGIGDTTFLISKMIGERGRAIGLDSSPERIAICKKRMAREKIRNVSFIVDDVCDTAFEDNAFDFVFSRFLFQHLMDPKKAVNEMLRLRRRGGIIGAEEFVHGSWFSDPPDPSIDKLRRSYIRIAKMNGSDPLIARKLPGLFADVGLKTNVEPYVVCAPMNNPQYKQIPLLLANVLKDRIIRYGIASEQTFEEMCNGIRHYTKRRDLPLLYAMTLRIWSTK
jgi:ubiquinone/menaquinone biosynthesis C-methylase UbiE